MRTAAGTARAAGAAGTDRTSAGMAASARTRMAHRNVDDIDMNIGVRRIAVAVGAVFRVFFGLFDLALLNDFLALDHTAAAVRAVVLALFPGGAASRTGLVR